MTIHVIAAEAGGETRTGYLAGRYREQGDGEGDGDHGGVGMGTGEGEE